MGLLDRVNSAAAETRAIGGVPWRPWDSPVFRFDAGGPVHPTRALYGGIDGALKLAPVYACVRVLADGVAKLPMQQYRDMGDRKVKMPAGQLLTKPSSYGNLYDWLFIAMTSLALHGNAYGLISSRDGYGYPTTIDWLPPEAVTVEDSEPYNPAKAIFYYYGAKVNREDLLHIRAFALPGRTEAVSPLRSFQLLIESGQNALAYGDGWYRSGGFPPGTFQNTQYEVDDEQSAIIKRRLVNSMQRREPLVYGRDWDYKAISVPPNEAQFVEAMQLNATQIAAVYGVQARKAGGIHGDSQTYSNVSWDQMAEVTDTLDPWLVRFETALKDCLPAQQYVSFNRDARIRYDIQTRYNVYKTARDAGILTTNQILDLEERPHATGGIGDDPLPLEVLVAMARGIKEIPKSFEELVTESETDRLAREQAAVLAKEAQQNPQAPPPPVYPEQGGAQAQNGKSAPSNGKQPANQGNGNGRAFNF